MLCSVSLPGELGYPGGGGEYSYCAETARFSVIYLVQQIWMSFLSRVLFKSAMLIVRERSHITKFSPIFNNSPLLFTIVSMVTG